MVDGYPEVQQAARAALLLPNDDRDTPNAVSLVVAPTFTPAVSVAAIRGACDFLSAETASFYEKDNSFSSVSGCSRVVDIAEETATSTALRALHGGASLELAQTGSVEPALFCLVEEAMEARVGALEAVEAWLAITLTGGPPLSFPWTEPGLHGSAGVASAPGGSLSTEARDAVRALLGIETVGGLSQTRVVGAAVEAVDEFRNRCCEPLGGRRGERVEEEDGESDEGVWQRVYCGLLVRLEVLRGVVTSAEKPPVRTALLPAQGAVHKASERQHGTVLQKKKLIEDLSAQPKCRVSVERASDVSNTDHVGGHATLAFLARNIAQALTEVPFAFEEAVPFNIDNDETLSVSEKKALRVRGDRRRRWITAAALLLLRAGTRFCELYQEPMAVSEGDQRKERDAAVLDLLVGALPFQQASTRADDPVEAWLACVRPDPLHSAVSSSLSTTVTDPAGAIPAATTAARELTTPVSWEACVQGQALPRHELSAPWVADAITAELGAGLVEAAWKCLSLGDGGNPMAKRSAEVLVQRLRATARRRGWRAEAGVGVKHAVSAAIRRLRFPLVSGATLGHALPLVLPLSDDHDPAHQAVGLSLLLHLMVETTSTELAWHRSLLLEVIERGFRGGGRDSSASMLCLAAAVRLLRRAPKGDNGGDPGGAGIRIAREALAQAGRTSDGAVRVIMVCGATALLELPATRDGYAPCELLRPALLGLLPILQVILSCVSIGMSMGVRARPHFCGEKLAEPDSYRDVSLVSVFF